MRSGLPESRSLRQETVEPTNDAAPDPTPDAPVVAVRRGDLVESVHRGRYVIRDAGGGTLGSLGDPKELVHLRSSAKPFQALPLVFSGAADAFGLTSEERAVACASHNAEARHLSVVRSILRKAGLSEADLRSGAHPPLHTQTAARLLKSDEEPRPIHSNCSGKHAGMLAVCAHAGWDPAGYSDPDGPLQKLVRRTIAKLCGLEPEEIQVAGDNCGVPVFVLPLGNLALGFARLATKGEANTQDFPEDLAEAVKRVREAMRRNPFMVAGTGRFDTALMKATDLVAKSGAEGVFAAAHPDGWGLALKVSDGASRAVAPMALAALAKRGVQVPEEMTRKGTVSDLHGETVGEIVPLF